VALWSKRRRRRHLAAWESDGAAAGGAPFPYEGTMFSKLLAEFIGTFWLVPGGCGSPIPAEPAVSGGPQPDLGLHART